MRKLVNVLMSALLALSMAACTPKSSVSKEEQAEKDAEELKEYGDVKIEDGVAVLEVTLPAEYAVALKTVKLDSFGEFLSTETNSDGSVTIHMTKEQYDNVVSTVKKHTDELIEKLENQKEFTITSVEYNDDLTKFDVHLKGTKLGIIDSTASLMFYMIGGLNGVLTGKTAPKIEVNYYGSDGKLITSDTQN